MINFNIIPMEGNVVVTMSQSLSWLKLTPEEARNLAKILEQTASQCDNIGRDAELKKLDG